MRGFVLVERRPRRPRPRPARARGPEQIRCTYVSMCVMCRSYRCRSASLSVRPTDRYDRPFHYYKYDTRSHTSNKRQGFVHCYVLNYVYTFLGWDCVSGLTALGSRRPRREYHMTNINVFMCCERERRRRRRRRRFRRRRSRLRALMNGFHFKQFTGIEDCILYLQ